MAKIQNKDFRNYDKEAREMIKGLPSNQLYELYEIVCDKLRVHQEETRAKELIAVRKAIEAVPRLQPERLRAARRGYVTDMARDARAKDGNTRPNRKKV
jgi:hypothetical protein